MFSSGTQALRRPCTPVALVPAGRLGVTKQGARVAMSAYLGASG